MAKRRQSRYAQQAALQALVRFGPEERGLVAIQKDAEARYRQAVRAAHGSAAGIVNAVDAARPQVGQVYDRAGAQANAAYGIAAPDLQGLGGVAQSIQAAAALERSGLAGRLAESKAADLSGLATRRVQAKSGEQFAVGQARSSLEDALTRVLEQRQGVSREKGAFTAATLGDLEEAAAQRAQQLDIANAGNSQSERNSLRSSGIDPDTGKPIPGGKLTKKGGGGSGGWASPEAHAKAQDQIQSAMHEIQTLKEAGADRHEIAALLSSGAKDQEIDLFDPKRPSQRQVWKDGEKGNEDNKKTGQPKTRRIPGVPKIESQLLLSTALDEAFDGHVSRRNTRLLHKRQLQIGALPVTPYGQWARKEQERRRRASNRTPAQQAGSVAGTLAKILGVGG